MSALLDKIRAEKLARAAGESRPADQKIGLGDVSLKGTGLTKRVIERNNAAYEKETAKSITAEKSLFVDSAVDEFQTGLERTIAEMRAANQNSDIVFDESQIKAIAGIIHNKVSVLIGAAGTGKTTVTKEITRQLGELFGKISSAEVNFVYVKEGDVQVRMREVEAIRRGLMESTAIQEQISIAFAAYTGRATEQMKRALPEEWHKNASTIHRLLGYAPTFEEFDYQDPVTKMWATKERRVFRPSFDASCKLPYQVYVFDEASMIPIPLFNEVIDAIHETSRILLIGDIHQLPPVYGKSVLGYAMRKWPVFELTTIHRQAAGNAIISNAHNVLRGKQLENADNFHLIGNGVKSPSPGGMGELQKYFLQVIQKLHKLNRYDPFKDHIIVPGSTDQKGNMVSSDGLNPHLVTMFNPEIKENGIIINKRIHIHTGTGAVYFAVRDKVMIISNINTVEPPITNGMIGIVESININSKYDMKRSQVDFDSDDDTDTIEIDLDGDNLGAILDEAMNEKKEKEEDETSDQRQSSHVLTIKFENGQTYSCSTAGDFRRVTHGYAATCHKSQGGEYPNVIILCHSVNAVMLTQEWLYTAITRARNNVYIVCNDRGLQKALSRQVIKGYTLKEKIKSYVIEVGADDEPVEDKMRFPVLWEPKEL